MDVGLCFDVSYLWFLRSCLLSSKVSLSLTCTSYAGDAFPIDPGLMSIPLKVPAIRTYERITFVSGKAIQFFFNMQENLVFPHRFRLSVSFIDMQSGGLLPLLHYLWVNGFPGTHTVLQRPKAVPEEREKIQSLCFNRGGEPTTGPLIYSHSNYVNNRKATEQILPTLTYLLE